MRQSCLLSPQGRILVEMGIYIPQQLGEEEALYIACDASQADELLKKLKLYHLRRKISLEMCDDLTLIAYDTDTPIADIITSAPDMRAPHRGHHAIITTASLTSLALSDNDAYHARRLLDAIPEGPQELTPNRALMLEAGLDIFEAVDFRKGCYIGQEVTARTRYRGLVKRRLIPVRGASLNAGGALISNEKEVGSILATAAYDDGMVGLASVRLAAIHEAEEGAIITSEGTEISLAIPAHLRPLPKPEAK
jgi:folate-binding protein YgfZ